MQRQTLSFTISAGVSDYDIYAGPLGGGICLGNARVTEPKEDAGASWSPDGRRVAFYRQTTTLNSEVFVSDADGGRLRNLSRRIAEFSWSPDWSPDGSRVVFVASGRRSQQLMTVRPDGSDLRPVPGTAVGSEGLLAGPTWSPDGTWIGFGLDGDTHIIRPDGSDRRVLLANASGLDWSPDGQRIVFTRDGDLAFASSDGSGITFVTSTPNLFEGAAEWSPDGSKIVYVSIDETDPKVGNGPGDHLYLADANGRNRRAVNGPRGTWAWGPAWRPAAPKVKTRPCAILGTPRADVLVGTLKGDLIYPGRGNDVVRGRGGDDIILGDPPYSARAGNDRLFGGPGRDYIDSYDELRDFVDGGAGRDRAMYDPKDRVRSIASRG